MSFEPLGRRREFATGWGRGAPSSAEPPHDFVPFAPAARAPARDPLFGGLGPASANQPEPAFSGAAPGAVGAPGPDEGAEGEDPGGDVLGSARPASANEAPAVDPDAVLAPVRAELDAERERARALIEELQELRERVVAAARRDLVEAVWIVMRRVLLAEVRTDRELVERIVDAVSDELVREEHVVVRVSTRDHAWLQPRQDELARRAGVRRLLVEPDRNLDLGGCVLEASFGRIDASVGAQLEVFRAELDRFEKDPPARGGDRG